MVIVKLDNKLSHINMADLSIPLGIPSLELITQTIDKEGNIMLTVQSMKAEYNGTHKLDNKINKMRYNFKTKQRRLYV